MHGLGSSTGTWATYQELHPWWKLTLHPQTLISWRKLFSYMLSFISHIPYPTLEFWPSRSWAHDHSCCDPKFAQDFTEAKGPGWMEVDTALSDSKAVSLTLMGSTQEESAFPEASSIFLPLRVISLLLISLSVLVVTDYPIGLACFLPPLFK